MDGRARVVPKAVANGTTGAGVEMKRSAMVGQVGREVQTASVGKERWRKDGGDRGRGRRSLYLEKAAGRPKRRALPERVALNGFGRSLAWKQEPAAFSPSARL